ncbi:MAG TPA: ATP-dependent metallopeptidase FtsH/Yme1/Tma family protein [Chloroflexia bacterium]|nr:ATP-dependent metallopeptidase FtsH/Yme1/Tma family protein [Chloroflexia bacterium]
MNVQNSNSPGWEYTDVQVTDPAAAIRQYRAEGWDLVSAVPVPLTPASPGTRLGLPRACLPFAVAVGLIMLFVLFLTFLGGRSRSQEVPISQLVRDIQAGRVTSILRSEDSNRLVVYYGDPSSKDTPIVTSVKEPESGLVEYLAAAGVPPETLTNIIIEVEPSSSLGNYLGIAGFCLPPIFFIAIVGYVGWRLIARTQQWVTLVIFRRPAGTRIDAEAQAAPMQDE